MVSKSLRGLLFVVLAVSLMAPVSSKAAEACFQLGNNTQPVIRFVFSLVSATSLTGIYEFDARLRTTTGQWLGSGTGSPSYKTGGFFDVGLHLVRNDQGATGGDAVARTCDFFARFGVGGPKWWVKCPAIVGFPAAEGSGSLTSFSCASSPATEQGPTEDIPGLE